MRSTMYVVIGLALMVAFLAPAPAVASDDPAAAYDDCIKVSVYPPGAAVDPLCLLPSPPERDR